MQKFKLVTEELAQSLKNLKKERTDQLKEIKQLYQQLQVKQKSPFEQTIERITKNMTFYKESEYKAANSGVNCAQIVQKYDSKIKKINEQISKLDKVIKNGCGTIVEKPATSRLKTVSHFGDLKDISAIEDINSKLEAKAQND